MAVEEINKRHIILGSASPRRHLLLEGLGIKFEIRTKDVEEVWPDHLTDADIPLYLCQMKAAAFPVSEFHDDTILITADTVVSLDGNILGKPHDRDDALHILRTLSGHKHLVISGVCLKTLRNERVFHVISEVWFREFSNHELEWYVDNYKPYDKAGSYGVQEWIGYVGIERINGSFYNVMGLPTQKLYLELLKLIQDEN